MTQPRHLTCGALLLAALFAGLVSTPAHANDRLPSRLRSGYGVALAQVRKYTHFIIDKVWHAQLVALRRGPLTGEARVERASELADEIAHLVLPHASRQLDDVLHGTGDTSLRVSMPDRVQRAAGPGTTSSPPATSASPAEALREALAAAGGAAERMLTDALRQALVEDVEDTVQRRVEHEVGLPVRGRPRGWQRPLPRAYADAYASQAHLDVHGFVYWWLRKRQRLMLSSTAATHSPAEIDHGEFTGMSWQLLSAVSEEVWAQNRLKLDFKWGRHNWEIDRRRLRRRMDQGLAQGIRALTRLVKEITTPETQQALATALEQGVREALRSPPLRARAEAYPHSADQLEKALAGLGQTQRPILNRAMDRVPLPPDIRALAREHGRRYHEDEFASQLRGTVRRVASGLAAAKRMREALPSVAGDAVARLDLGGLTREQAVQRALSQASPEVRARLRAVAEDAMREAGYDESTTSRGQRKERLDRLLERAPIDDALRRVVEGVTP